MEKLSTNLKIHRSFYLISLLSLAVFTSLQLFDPPLIRDYLESKTCDLRLHLRNFVQRPQPADNIVIVAVDEKSLAEIGRWPWSREVMARLVGKISQGRPKVIGIDIMFSERESREADELLARAIREAGNVVLATAFVVQEGGGDAKSPANAPDFLWDSAFMQVRTVPGIEWKKWAIKPGRVIPPVDEIARSALLGHVATHPDLDGVFRWEILAVNFGDDCYPSLPLQVARIAAGVGMKEMILFGGSGVRIGERFIPTDLSGRVVINYRGREKSFKYLSAADILAGRVDPALLRDKIVFLGTSALATYDQKVTPLSADMPGVEKNATVVDNILSSGFLRKSPGVVELAVILLTTAILAPLLPLLSAGAGVAVGLGMLGAYLAATVVLTFKGLLLSLIYPAANMTLILTTETVIKLLREERKAKDIRDMFTSYVSPKIVATLIKHPEKMSLGGERKTVSIMFCDLIGFTSLSERLPPEQVVALLNEYYREMAEIIFHWDGTLDKFVGDEIMAIWGAPLEQADHAERAMRCALHMSDRLDAMHRRWCDEGKDILDCGIGINTGEVLIGNIGLPGKKMDYTAIGNHVNIAARVEKLTRQHGSRILITGETLSAIEQLRESGRFGHIEFNPCGSVTVKGKAEEVSILAVVPLQTEENLPPP